MFFFLADFFVHFVWPVSLAGAVAGAAANAFFPLEQRADVADGSGLNIVWPFRGWELSESRWWRWFEGLRGHWVLLNGFDGLENGVTFHGSALWPGVGLRVEDGNDLFLDEDLLSGIGHDLVDLSLRGEPSVVLLLLLVLLSCHLLSCHLLFSYQLLLNGLEDLRRKLDGALSLDLRVDLLGLLKLLLNHVGEDVGTHVGAHLRSVHVGSDHVRSWSGHLVVEVHWVRSMRDGIRVKGDLLNLNRNDVHLHHRYILFLFHGHMSLVISGFAEDGHPLSGDVLISWVRRDVHSEGKSDSLGLMVHNFFSPPLLNHAVHSGPLVFLNHRPGKFVEVQLQRKLDADGLFFSGVVALRSLMLLMRPRRSVGGFPLAVGALFSVQGVYQVTLQGLEHRPFFILLLWCGVVLIASGIRCDVGRCNHEESEDEGH